VPGSGRSAKKRVQPSVIANDNASDCRRRCKSPPLPDSNRDKTKRKRCNVRPAGARAETPVRRPRDYRTTTFSVPPSACSSRCPVIRLQSSASHSASTLTAAKRNPL
jgi:hypothetical protein